MTYCSQKSNLETRLGTIESDSLILGVWTDGTGPNASIRFEIDSLYNVEALEMAKYELMGDSLIIYYEDEPIKAKINRLDKDSLIYVSRFGETKMWRFKD